MSAQNKPKKSNAKLVRQSPKARAVSSGAIPTESGSHAKANTTEIAPAKGAAAAEAKTAKKGLRRRRRGKRVAMGEALRREGLDERMVAETYASVVATLKDKSDKNGSVQKLLVDVLKEFARHLDPSRPTDRSGTGDTPVTVQLIHAVPRPERPPPPTGQGPDEVARGE